MNIYIIIQGSAVGSGPIDALHSAIMDVCDLEIKLLQYDTCHKVLLTGVNVNHVYSSVSSYYKKT